jgi:hypothetical protein
LVGNFLESGKSECQEEDGKETEMDLRDICCLVEGGSSVLFPVLGLGTCIVELLGSAVRVLV